MRVCVLSTSYPRSNDDDAGIFVKRLVCALDKAGATGQVITPLDAAEPRREQEGKFEIHRYAYGIFSPGRLAFGSGILPKLRKNPLLLCQVPGLIAAMALKAFRLRNGYDVMHANWISAGLAAWLCSIVSRKPYVITLRGEDVKLIKSAWLRPLLRAVIRSAFAVTSVNKAFLDCVRDLYGVPAAKLHYLPNGVSVNSNMAAAAVSIVHPERQRLIFVGRIIPLKRLEILIALLSQPGMQDYDLLICGPCEDKSYLSQLERACSAHNCEDRVRFLGRVPPDEIAGLLASSRFYLSSSSYEGRSNSILEALAAGKTVFASNIPAHAELIRNGENGFLFEPGDIAGLSALIHKVASDPACEKMVAQAAMQTVRSYSWEACAAEYIKVFSAAAGRGAQVPADVE